MFGSTEELYKEIGIDQLPDFEKTTVFLQMSSALILIQQLSTLSLTVNKDHMAIFLESAAYTLESIIVKYDTNERLVRVAQSLMLSMIDELSKIAKPTNNWSDSSTHDFMKKVN